MASWQDPSKATVSHPGRKPGGAYQDNPPDYDQAHTDELVHDYPYIHPVEVQAKPVLHSNDRDQLIQIDRNPVAKANVQRPSLQRPSKIDVDLAYDMNDKRQQPKVSFANGKKRVQLQHEDAHRPSIPSDPRRKQSNARRPSRRFSVAAQQTVGGKICAVWRNIYTMLGLRQWAFIFVLIGYAFLGGFLFSWCERGRLNRENAQLLKNLKNERQNLTKDIIDIMHEQWKYGNSLEGVSNAITNRLEHYQMKQRKLGPKGKPVWDLWDGIFYSFTVITTIGYGHYTPETTYGRLTTILYALIGIPLLLAMLADFGRLLTRGLKKVWSWVRNGIRRVLAMRRFKKLQHAAQKAGLDIEEEGEGIGGIAAEDEEFHFPIPLALFLIVAWMFICAGFFMFWEDEWTYFEAFYFFFISLSTIGLGDLTPKHQKYMMLCFPLVLIGLSLVTLVINLIQNKIEDMKERAKNMLEDQLGLDEESATDWEEPEEVVWPKPDDLEDESGGTIPATPTSMDSTPPQLRPHERTGSKKVKHPKPDERITLGIIQTTKMSKPRRRIGTQTDDSYVRDVIHRSPRKPHIERIGSDRFSLLTGNSEYFDAQSLA